MPWKNGSRSKKSRKSVLTQESRRRIDVMSQRDGITPKVCENDSGITMDLTYAAGVDDPPRSFECLLHSTASLIRITQQPKDVRKVVQRRRPGIVTPLTGQMCVNRRIIEFQHHLHSSSGGPEISCLERRKCRHAMQNETTCWIAFAGKLSARPHRNRYCHPIVAAETELMNVPWVALSTACMSPSRLPNS